MSDNTTYEIALKQLGDKLRNVRIDKGLTMREVADRCGMEENNYGRFEKAQTNPTFKSLLMICEVLEIELKELL